MAEVIKVASSHINAVDYQSGNLLVEFNNGKTYEYANVPETLYNDMLKAESVGKHFNKFIKTSHACREVQILPVKEVEVVKPVEQPILMPASRIVSVVFDYEIKNDQEYEIHLTFKDNDSYKTVIIKPAKNFNYPVWFNQEIPSPTLLVKAINDYSQTAPMKGKLSWNGKLLVTLSNNDLPDPTPDEYDEKRNRRLERAKREFGT